MKWVLAGIHQFGMLEVGLDDLVGEPLNILVRVAMRLAATSASTLTWQSGALMLSFGWTSIAPEPEPPKLLTISMGAPSF